MNLSDFGVMRSKVTEVIVYMKMACSRNKLKNRLTDQFQTWVICAYGTDNKLIRI